MQSLLARLYTDADLRERFLAEPDKIGRENSLNEKEIEQIAEVLPEELRFFAESLFHKRLHEVEKLLPLTQSGLGEKFAAYFREFSNQFVPNSIKKHLEDAIAFADFLEHQRLEPLWLSDLVRFERARLEFNNLGKRFIFRRFQYDIREISRKGAEAQSFKPRRTFAVWLKIGKNKRHFVW